MPTEITAGIMFGPIRTDSNHGRPSGLPGGRLFTPSHVLVLMEGSRATWIVQRCPNLQRPMPTERIQPASPRHLLASAVLGYTALVTPEALEDSGPLRAMTSLDTRYRTVEVDKVDDDLADAIYDRCREHVYGVVTWLPGSTITRDELRLAAGAGMQIAVAGGPVA